MSTIKLIPLPQRITAFPRIPSLDEWKKRSCVGKASGPPLRKNDPALVKIDNLIRAYNSTGNAVERNYLLTTLWFTTGYWHNHVHIAPGLGITPGREPMRNPAIMALLLTVQNELMKTFNCGLHDLAAELTQTYGKNMDTHGHVCDFVDKGSEFYLTEASRDKFRIVFKPAVEGEKLAAFRLAWRFDWTENDWRAKPLRRLDTRDNCFFSHTKLDSPGWAFFVMSMSSDIYMGPHIGGKTKDVDGGWKYPKFHSSYMGGNTVQCGGSMRVIDGVVTGVKNDSGHYKPVDESLVKVLEMLKTAGQDIRKVDVRTILGEVTGKEGSLNRGVRGDVFVAQNGNWDAIRKGSCREIYADFSAGRKDLLALVNEYFRNECDSIRKMAAETLEEPIIDEKKIWPAAYRAVCWDLALFDPKWKARADAPPIPRTAHLPMGLKKVA